MNDSSHKVVLEFYSLEEMEWNFVDNWEMMFLILTFYVTNESNISQVSQSIHKYQASVNKRPYKEARRGRDASYG